jgi:hypothetical protein
MNTGAMVDFIHYSIIIELGLKNRPDWDFEVRPFRGEIGPL